MMVQVGVMRGARRELRETVPTPRARDLLLLVLDCSLGQYARESSLVGDLQIAGAAHRLLLLGSARGTGFVEVCHCLRSSGRPTAITDQVDRHLQEAGGASIERRWPSFEWPRLHSGLWRPRSCFVWVTSGTQLLR